MNLNKISRRNLFVCGRSDHRRCPDCLRQLRFQRGPHPLPPLPPEPLQNRWSSSFLPPPPSLRP